MIARTAYLDSEVGYHLFDVCALYTFIFFPVFSKKQCSLLDVLAKQIKFSMLDQAILWLCSQMSKRKFLEMFQWLEKLFQNVNSVLSFTCDP